MNYQLEDFNNYYLMKLKEDENEDNMNGQEEIEVQLSEEKKDEINNKENIKCFEVSESKNSNSKNMDCLHKRYQTYTIEYKKKIIEEVRQIYKL